MKSIKHIRTKATESIYTLFTQSKKNIVNTITVLQHVAQVLRERIPFFPHIFDLWNKKWLFSRIHINDWSRSYRGRIIIILSESIMTIVILLYWRSLYHHAHQLIKSFIFYHTLPIVIDLPTIIIIITSLISITSYIFLVKKGDINQAISNIKKR